MTAPIDHVLVVKLGALGDLILADGALHDIRAHHPSARIHLLTRRPFLGLMQRCPWVDVVHVDENARRWQLAAMLRWKRWIASVGASQVYDLQHSSRTRFYRRWLAARSQPWSTIARSDRNARRAAVPERLAIQLERAGVPVLQARTPRPHWIAEDTAALRFRAGIDGPFVLLLPGASARHPHKRWPWYGELSQVLTDAGTRVVTVLGPDEAGDSGQYAGTLLDDQGHWLSIPQLADVARHAACVVGNDSGPLHLAACLDAPCVALFESGNPSLQRTGIEQRNAIRLDAPRLADIHVQAVADAVWQQLQAQAPSTPCGTPPQAAGI